MAFSCILHAHLRPLARQFGCRGRAPVDCAQDCTTAPWGQDKRLKMRWYPTRRPVRAIGQRCKPCNPLACRLSNPATNQRHGLQGCGQRAGREVDRAARLPAAIAIWSRRKLVSVSLKVLLTICRQFVHRSRTHLLRCGWRRCAWPAQLPGVAGLGRWAAVPHFVFRGVFVEFNSAVQAILRGWH